MPPPTDGTRVARARIRALLFDKDGTFTDFRATWEPVLAPAVRALAVAAQTDPAPLARIVGVDLVTGRIAPHGRFVTGTNAQTIEPLAAATGWSVEALGAWWRPRFAGAEQVAVLDLDPFLGALRGRGMAIGVLTNAGRREAEAHLAHLGAAPHVDRLVACDDGYGAKPDPRGALAFAEGLGLDPAEVVVIGDGMTDMLAAAGAGMRAIGVTTGTLGPAELSPHAETVLADISGLPAWLEDQRAG